MCQTVTANKSEATNDNQKESTGVKICMENYKLLVYSNKAHHLAFAGSVSIDSCLLVNIVYIAVYQSQN